MSIISPDTVTAVNPTIDLAPNAAQPETASDGQVLFYQDFTKEQNVSRWAKGIPGSSSAWSNNTWLDNSANNFGPNGLSITCKKWQNSTFYWGNALHLPTPFAVPENGELIIEAKCSLIVPSGYSACFWAKSYVPGDMTEYDIFESTWQTGITLRFTRAKQTAILRFLPASLSSSTYRRSSLLPISTRRAKRSSATSSR